MLAPKRETQLFGSDSLLPASDSLIANKFSLFRRLGNSVGKGLNFLPKAEVPWLFQARNRRISLYFPVEQGTGAAETGSLMTASSAKNSQSLRAHPAQSRTVHVCFGVRDQREFCLAHSAHAREQEFQALNAPCRHAVSGGPKVSNWEKQFVRRTPPIMVPHILDSRCPVSVSRLRQTR